MNNSGISSQAAASNLDTITYAKIHPGIGVARVGNSTASGTDGYYIGPEVVNGPYISADDMRDPTGALKRQAARFRIYGYNAAGEVVAELTKANAEIYWMAHLANQKASWYVFHQALDIQGNAVDADGQALDADDNAPVGRRNPQVTGDDRRKLTIDAGLAVKQANSDTNVELTGTFCSGGPTVNVKLGDLRVDDEGRLLVLGGHGISRSPNGKPMLGPNGENFNNSPDWYDDTSDGPVLATVSINGTPIPVTSSWVIVAPPNYGTDIVSFRTLYDVARDAMVEAGRVEPDFITSFSKHVLPYLQRLTRLQWVNAGFFRTFAYAGAIFPRDVTYDFTDPTYLLQLADPSDQAKAKRQEVFGKFHSPYLPTTDTANIPEKTGNILWPPIYGDTMHTAVMVETTDMLPVSLDLYRHLTNWRDGNFTNDYDPNASTAPVLLNQVPLQQQPALLDEGPLTYCLGDAFHPGCEATWPMRHASMYSELARIRRATSPELLPDLGDTLSHENVAASAGPLYYQTPGGLTRWMALPWQGDTARCRSGYDPDVSPYLPTFWPARVPNQVLSTDSYDMLMDTTRAVGLRGGYYQTRDNWMSGLLDPSNEITMQNMVDNFQNQPIITRRPGPTDAAIAGYHIPSVVYVASAPGGNGWRGGSAFVSHADGLSVNLSEAVDPADRAELLRRAGWLSEEQLKSQFQA
ncbi:LodA/GoxA family CTQ-dependent oxidase [Bordetella sp. N]|uniref:LodA/GoxA family CTQ-dependent oxidase n=1 Tax=Bordetella sp. N TaxID=1746199 RepID=UPI000710AE1C|nr:LodA/GoxA family CTQ-dependent oxidase [Bordetella sp. N]ALM82524.1 hypothetical protein ASB57_05710 [Bordetella sp. N]